MKRILWVSDLVTPTGFSRVAHSIIERLKSKFSITGVGINYRGTPHKLGIDIYPASLRGNIYGESVVAEILSATKYDILFILNDAPVIDMYLRAIKNSGVRVPKIVTYIPVDAVGHSPEWYSNFDIVTTAVAYTNFGKNEIISASNGAVSPIVIPHGIDTNLFFEIKDHRRVKIDILGDEYADSFIFLNANRNQPRKRWDVTIQAFAELSKKYNDVVLYVHAGLVDAHIDISKAIKYFGISPKSVVASSRFPGVQTVPDQFLNLIYNACDVGLNTSLGEGWGLTNVEHAVTGAVQIVPEHSACAELFSGCGVLVPPKFKYIMDAMGTVGGLVLPEDVFSAMESVYLSRDKSLAQKAKGKFLSDTYSWNTICRTWENLFEGMPPENHPASAGGR